jgi:S-adenosylmethionine:tRNA ribosyltransferase-isomerase
MIAATSAVQRPDEAKLLAVDDSGRIAHLKRSRFVSLLRRGDLVIANDAATLPASLSGIHLASRCPLEVRLAGRNSLAAGDVGRFSAVVFGSGDFRTRTEDREAPPALAAGDRLLLGPLSATVEGVLNHPRFISLRFEGSPAAIWEGLARHGRPIQYSHLRDPLAIWDTWTPIAGSPAAFEPPSAGFVLDWSILASMNSMGVRFATLTHAAGISSTGDPELDALLPFDEPYRIPDSTADAIELARLRGSRIIAIGTSVVRALEHSAARDGVVRSGENLATQRIGPGSRIQIVDAILSGTHEPGTSHYEMLRAFIDDETLGRADSALNFHGYLTHEFGDSVFIERQTAVKLAGASRTESLSAA